ncbi:unnamed protein product, partial [Amoebophrya sp. A25]
LGDAENLLGGTRTPVGADEVLELVNPAQLNTGPSLFPTTSLSPVAEFAVLSPEERSQELRTVMQDLKDDVRDITEKFETIMMEVLTSGSDSTDVAEIASRLRRLQTRLTLIKQVTTTLQDEQYLNRAYWPTPDFLLDEDYEEHAKEVQEIKWTLVNPLQDEIQARLANLIPRQEEQAVLEEEATFAGDEFEEEPPNDHPNGEEDSNASRPTGNGSSPSSPRGSDDEVDDEDDVRQGEVDVYEMSPDERGRLAEHLRTEMEHLNDDVSNIREDFEEMEEEDGTDTEETMAALQDLRQKLLDVINATEFFDEKYLSNEDEWPGDEWK